MVYGYARCSTNESRQDIRRQVRELKAAGAEQVFLEYEHGDSSVKPQQAQMLEQAQKGDSIVTLEVPRLARSTQQLCQIIDLVREKGLRLVIIGSITLDCRSGQPDPIAQSPAKRRTFLQPQRRLRAAKNLPHFVCGTTDPAAYCGATNLVRRKSVIHD